MLLFTFHSGSKIHSITIAIVRDLGCDFVGGGGGVNTKMGSKPENFELKGAGYDTYINILVLYY